jgi:hypothetical protein
LADRSISFSPSSVSKRWMDSEIAGCVRSSFSAAREKLFSLATVRKTLERVQLHKIQLYNDSNLSQFINLLNPAGP